MKYDVIVFPVIDWYFRLQRPQQLALELARKGHRVFYLTTEFLPSGEERPYLFLEQTAENVFVVQLRCPDPAPNIYKRVPTDEQVEALLDAFALLRRSVGLGLTVSIVDLPFWRRIAQGLPGNLLVYDCMDYHPGFLNNEQVMLEEEDRLIRDADLVLTTSAGLQELVEPIAPNVLVRNACDVGHFLPRPDVPPRRLSERSVVGYFGAIDHWFDIELLIKSARAYPEWDFILIGRTAGSDVSEAETLPNVRFLGEIPYQDLPAYAAGFDVCTIPFQIVELTLHTNPVKLYEYLAAGKPVVGTAMPEIMIGGDKLVYVGLDHADYIAKLGEAMRDHDDPEAVSRRIAFARRQTWGDRIETFEQALADAFPKVSVVVLTYNNLALTQKCLASIDRHSHYPNLEIVIVDNRSTDGSIEWLRSYAAGRADVQLILNEENLGFAAGNNRGLAAATGEVLVLLNNDTQVTHGWVLDLVRHLRRDPTLGLVGPVTNNIGNEARIEVSYDGEASMLDQARRYAQSRRLAEIEARTPAFFCAAIPRRVYEAVGGLDEIFGVGMFEDDDYCRRIEGAGFRVAVADDVFVHHELSASLNELGLTRKKELFERNKALYEQKWGAWIPHKYREQA